MSKSGQLVHHPVLAARLFALLAWCSIVAGPVNAGDPIALGGTVRDAVGGVLDGVEILLVRLPARSLDPTAVTRSDRAGRFEIASLLPGRYRVAALKSGYRTFVGQVDTVVSVSLDVVLHPTSEVDPTSLPEDATWALRVPRRGILYEVDPEPALRSSDPSPTPGGGTFDADLGLEVEQYFSLSAGAAESSHDEAEIQATETRMMLTSALGEHGSVRLDGRRERLGSGSPGDPGESTASQEGARLSMDMSYDTGPEARLALAAFFNETDYELSARLPTAPDSRQQQRQTWGYDANWSMQLDATRRVAVDLEFQNSSLAGSVPGLAGGAPADPGRAVANRTVTAEGSYSTLVSSGHDVELALRAQMLTWPTDTLSASGPPAADPSSSWLVQADARDTWSFAGPLSLVYGLGCRQALETQDATLVVPRLGGVLSTGPWSVRALISYHTVVGSNEPPGADSPVPFSPKERLGYDAEVEFPVAREVQVRGGVSYSPIQFDHVGYAGTEALGDHPLYLTDGNTAVREYRIAVVEQRGSSRTYVEAVDGRAEGNVVALLPFEGPLPIVPGSRLQYRNGRLGVVFPELGTDVRVQYERVEAAIQGSPAAVGTSVAESVELRLKQEVSRLPVPGNWRFVMALRMGTLRSDDLVAWSSPDGSRPVDALNRRVSAGVSVLF